MNMEKYHETPEENSLDSMEGLGDFIQTNKSEKKEYFFFPDEKQRMMLGEAMEDVIDNVAESNHIDNKERSTVPSIIFLDKSARPLSTLFRDLWRKKFPDSPDMYVGFLNFGREIIKYTKETGETEIVNVDSDHSLKMWKNKIRDSFLKDVPQGGVITVVDDIKATGSTEKAVVNFLREIFPYLQFNYIALANAHEGGRLFTPDNLDKLELFESKQLRGGHLSKKPVWASLKQGGEDINGLTGVMDESDPGEFSLRQRLSTVPYRKHRYFSTEEREKRESKYIKNKEVIEKLFALVNEFMGEIILWEPNLTKQDFDDLDGLQERLASFKGEVQNLSNLIEQKRLKGYETYNLLQPFFNSFINLCYLIKKVKNQNTRKEVFDKLGVKEVGHTSGGFAFAQGGNIMVYENSIAEKIANSARITGSYHYEIEYGFDKQLIEKNIDELVRQLRNEMHHVADEYWSKKNKTE